MKRTVLTDALLMLEDGTVFNGKSFSNSAAATGEICFNTGMTGYQEIFTDPSYYGQILVTTTSHIGNYGSHLSETESDSIQVSGLVCKKFSPYYSRSSASSAIVDFFADNRIPVIFDVDTRAVVRHIRDKGAMNAIISSDTKDKPALEKMLTAVPSMQGLELSSKVTTSRYYLLGNPAARFRIAVLDLGVKRNILKCLIDYDCCVHVFPMKATYDEMVKIEPDGFLISNGPGDPSAMNETIATVKKILEKNHPLFGICLGYQILALASGLSTFKMHNGHRGVNHPIKNMITGNCEVTCQNHGFAVKIEDAMADKNIEITHVHLNDGTLAGFRIKSKKAFGVQFHPEASAGPHDSRYLFEDFIKMIQAIHQVKHGHISA